MRSEEISLKFSIWNFYLRFFSKVGLFYEISTWDFVKGWIILVEFATVGWSYVWGATITYFVSVFHLRLKRVKESAVNFATHLCLSFVTIVIPLNFFFFWMYRKASKFSSKYFSLPHPPLIPPSLFFLFNFANFGPDESMKENDENEIGKGRRRWSDFKSFCFFLFIPLNHFHFFSAWYS